MQVVHRNDLLERQRIYTLQELREKASLFAKKFNAEKIYLFGSYARGEADEKSDIDLVVQLSKTREYGMEYFAMEEIASEIFGISVDVVDLDALMNPRTYTALAVKKNFEKEKVLLYEKRKY